MWPLSHVEPSTRETPRAAAELVIASIGLLLVASALAATQRWLDRHFLPSFLMPRHWYVAIQTTVRIVIGLTGVALLVVRRGMARAIARTPARVVHIAIAVVLALGASELVLRRAQLRPAEWLLPEEEPRRRPDPRLGWVLVPARTGHSTLGGRAIEYAIDAAGYRVRRVDEPVDPEGPAILFTGESVMFGEGLMWEETVPAQVGAILGVQSANLAVHGFSTDQTYLRLQTELPRFRRPIAVVTLFMTSLFGRNLDADRPHLDPGLVWRPARHRGRLLSLAALLVPYRRGADVEQGITVTRQVLRATVDLARARGAAPLIVVPQLGAESAMERHLRQSILDRAGVPYVFVEIDAAWRLAWDRHPNPAAARIIAVAVAARLRAR